MFTLSPFADLSISLRRAFFWASEPDCFDENDRVAELDHWILASTETKRPFLVEFIGSLGDLRRQIDRLLGHDDRTRDLVIANCEVELDLSANILTEQHSL